MEKANQDIRRKIRILDLKHWQVAKEIGITEGTLCVWLRSPLSKEKKTKINNAISRLTAAYMGEKKYGRI